MDQVMGIGDDTWTVAGRSFRSRLFFLIVR